MTRPFCEPWLHLLRLNTGDADLGQLGTVTHAAAVSGLVLVLQDVDFGALGLVKDFSGNADLGQSSSLGGNRGAIDDKQSLQLNS